MPSSVAGLFQDLRYGARNLARNPGFTLAAALTLGLGIGANTTIFSVINHTLLQPIAFRDPSRLVLVWEKFRPGPNSVDIVSTPNFWDFERQSRSFESMAIFDSAGRGYNLAASGDAANAEQVSGLRVSSGFFRALGVKPLLGRTFLPEEDQPGKDHEVVLSYSLWQTHYQGDPSIVGRAIRIDGEDFEVAGVMPASFDWQFFSPRRRLWVPAGYNKTDYGRGNSSFISIARLKPGVSVEQARAEVGAIAGRLAQAYPDDDRNMSATVVPLADFGMARIRSTMIILFAAVAFVLLIACVNVANLQLARGAGRRKEFAIRRALGAAPFRIARQLMTESFLLALAGGAAGGLLALAATRTLFSVLKLGSLNLPLRPVDSIPLDGRVLGFTLLATLLTGLLFGAVPAWSAARTALNERSNAGGNRLRHALVAAEVALALIVLCGAGLMIRSMARLLGVDPGFDPAGVLTMSMSVPQDVIYGGPPGLPLFCRDLTDHARAVPGVFSISAIAHLPLRGNAGRGFTIEGQPPPAPGHMPGADYTVACPDYFRTMRIPLREGREFTSADTLTSPGVAVINEALARAYWPDQDPVGHVIRLGDGTRLTIVGVAGDVRYEGLDTQAHKQFLRPYTQAGWPVMTVVARTAGAPETFAAPIRQAIAAFLPDRPVSDVQTMEQIVENSTGSRRLPMLLLSAFSLVALLLAAVGIAGVAGHTVAQRTREIGIRMALGAGAGDILRMTIGGNLLWVLAGMAAGLAGTAALTRLLGGLLFDVRPLDPAVLAWTALLLAAIALAASYLPARRAAKIDPVAALRSD